MDILSLVNLQAVMRRSAGNPDIAIGVIDGPVDLNHAAFHNSRIRTVKESQISGCRNSNSVACMHGTSVVGILAASREYSIQSICPGCEIIVWPIFKEDSAGSRDMNPRQVTVEELANAIIETVDTGVKIINLSLGFSTSSLINCDEINDAYDYAFRKRVIIVAASGNQGSLSHFFLLNHSWIIPVVACDDQGRIASVSNSGPTVGMRGLMAPGVNILSIAPKGEFSLSTGTSIATPFVTGTVALLMSIFPDVSPAQILYSIFQSHNTKRRTVIPPLLNASAALHFIESNIRKPINSTI